MEAALADLVYPVIEHSLRLRDRLEQGVARAIDAEQQTLKRLLEAKGGPAILLSPAEKEPALPAIRYALTCWVDELMLRYSCWQAAWSDQTLESSLYDSDDGTWKFWQQARQTLARADLEALEVYHLCVMLGFRGELTDAPENVRDWIKAADAKLASAPTDTKLPAHEQEPATHVPPLRGREQLQRMIVVCGLALLAAVPLIMLLANSH